MQSFTAQIPRSPVRRDPVNPGIPDAGVSARAGSPGAPLQRRRPGYLGLGKVAWSWCHWSQVTRPSWPVPAWEKVWARLSLDLGPGHWPWGPSCDTGSSLAHVEPRAGMPPAVRGQGNDATVSSRLLSAVTYLSSWGRCSR